MIAGVVREAINAVRGSERANTVPGFLRPIDTAAVARQLDLEASAVERGGSNIPPPEASAPDAVEQQILQRVESEWTWQAGELINNLRAYRQRLTAYAVESEFTRLLVQAKDTLAQLREADHRAEAELGPLREDYIAARNELSDFKKKHRLTRAARPHARRYTTFGLLFVLIALESMANGVFFAKGSEFGLVGGVGTAVVISFINVGVCFLLGLWPIRWINRRNVLVKFFALIVSLLGIAGIVALHAFAAHYRDAMAAVGEDHALRAAIATLRASPWTLDNLNSYYLFALGLFFALLSIYKGATFDDPYPAYGPMTRRHEAARNDYSDQHADLFDGLAGIKDETITLLDGGILKLPLYPQQAANIRAQRAALIQSFRSYESAVETAARQLLAEYRDINRKHRTAPAPRYFDQPWRLPHSVLETAEVHTLAAEEDEARLDMPAILAELRRYSQDVLDEYEKLMKTYPHPTKMG
jgi:hypothetical protein